MPRRNIQDLIARYILEPTLRDVYVEGLFDERVLRLFFKELKCDRPSINVIDLVEVPDSILEKHNLTRGENTELIAVAAEIFSSLGDTQHFTAVIDADFNRLLGRVIDNPVVLATDYTSMEMYWLDEVTVNRFFVWLGEHGAGLNILYRDISNAATELFLIRCAMLSLKLNASIIPFKKYCTSVGNALNLDSPRYCRSVLITSGVGALQPNVVQEVERLRQLLDADQRNRTHGHDLIELIYQAYRTKLGMLGIREVAALSTIIKMTMPIQQLTSYPMFQNLVARVC